ncbi:hypothetical protein [Cereibacter johrii]|uniref:hypothetical protein n=1 Tax=Cereibacter johrii TaxID=445629 RepID=UPI003CF5D12F
MQPIIRSITGNADINFEVKFRAELTLFEPFKKFPGGVYGHGQKAFVAKAAAAREGCNYLIYMVDADDTSPQRHNDIAGEILSGFGALKKPEVGCVACIPVSASEAWMLADKEAWRKLTGHEVANLPGKPEELWGEKRDPSSNRPHNIFARICAQEELADSSETRSLLAAHIDPGTLRRSCPASFTHFADMLLKPHKS